MARLNNRKGKTCLALFFCSLLLLKSYTLVGRIRRYAVRPMNTKRKEKGHFQNLVKFMKKHDVEQFIKYIRMTPEQFDELLELVKDDLQKSPHRNPLSPAERLTMTLHYLSEGCSMQQIAWDYYVGKSTVHCVVKETCKVLWEKLQPLYLEPPSVQDFEKIAKGFYEKWNMPNCLGALDGKHVSIQCPAFSGSEFFSYKKSFSFILLATCDAFYRFSMIDIGAPGSYHDSQVFHSSLFGNQFYNGEMPIPPPTNIPNTNIILPHFLVADQAFPLHQNILRPYPGRGLTDRQKIFNYRLSRARRTIENAFGILVQRWRILRKPIIANVETCQDIIKATVVLHNFLQKKEEQLPEGHRKYCPPGFVDSEECPGVVIPGLWRQNGCGMGLRELGRIGSNNYNRNARLNRETLANYFDSPTGSVEWQERHIYLGATPDLN